MFERGMRSDYIFIQFTRVYPSEIFPRIKNKKKNESSVRKKLKILRISGIIQQCIYVWCERLFSLTTYYIL